MSDTRSLTRLDYISDEIYEIERSRIFHGGWMLAARADRQTGDRVAHGFEEFEVAVREAGLAFSGGAESCGHVVLAFDVGLVCKVQMAPLGLRFASEVVFQVLLGLRTIQAHVDLL